MPQESYFDHLGLFKTNKQNLKMKTQNLLELPTRTTRTWCGKPAPEQGVGWSHSQWKFQRLRSMMKFQLEYSFTKYPMQLALNLVTKK